MSFTESLTKEVRRRSHFQCCLCKAIGVEIHHVVPQAEGGADIIENAAPLCPSCHEIYGANPTKRKFIREARDLWFEICANRYAPDASLLHQVYEVVENNASKEDISLLRSDIAQVLRAFGPNKAIYSVSIPRRQPAIGELPKLDIRDLLMLVSGTSNDRPSGQVEMLCMREFWPIKDGYRIIYNEFLERFGTRTLRHLAARALDQTNAEFYEGLTEDEIDNALTHMSAEAICMTYLDKGEFRAELNESNEIVWRTVGAESAT